MLVMCCRAYGCFSVEPGPRMISNISIDGQDDGGSGPPREVIELSRDIWEEISHVFV
jgi:hypothetical protein